MTQASQKIMQQYIDGGVIPAQLVGQDAASKTYVDGQLATRDDHIASALMAAGVAQADINSHRISTTAHPAQHITYSGPVTGSDVKQAIDGMNTRINSIVSQSGNDNTEIVDARDGYPVLGARLNAFDADKVSKNELVLNVLDFGAKGDDLSEDTQAFQDAIDLASASGGGDVFVPAKVTSYLIGTLTLKQGVNMRSNGAILKAKTGINYMIAAITGDNMAVDGFIFDCTGLTDVGGDQGVGGTAVYFPVTQGPYTHVRVSNNRFENIPLLTQSYHAILGSNVSGTASGNYILNCGGDVINFNGGYMVVTDNIILGSGDGGIAFNNAARGVIANNIIEKCDLGIGCGPEGHLSDEDTYYNQMIITGNLIKSCEHGIFLGYFGFDGRTGPTNFVVSNNTVKNCRINGIRYDGHDPNWEANGLITGNVVTGTGSDLYNGTSADSANDIVLGNCGLIIVSGNTCTRNEGISERFGIYVENSDRVSVEGNVIRGKDASAPYTKGIWIIDSKYSSINNNRINTVLHGIWNEDNARGRPKYNSMNGNHITEFLQGAISAMESASYFTINNNFIFGDVVDIWAISISPAATTFDISHNTIRVPGNGTIVINGPGPADNYRIHGNTLFGKPITDAGSGTNKDVSNNW